jgi:hypothetical protein
MLLGLPPVPAVFERVIPPQCNVTRSAGEILADRVFVWDDLIDPWPLGVDEEYDKCHEHR